MTETLLLWERIDRLLAVKVPSLMGSFNAGADKNEIASVETLLGVVFPDDLRASYLRHNGCQVNRDSPAFFVASSADWLSLAEVVAHWRMLNQVAENLKDDAISYSEMTTDPIRQEYWNSKRIPIATISGGGEIFIDLWPGPLGKLGQVVGRNSSDFLSSENLLASSLHQYLVLFAERLEQGLITYESGKGWLNTATQEPVLNWIDLSGW
jgi:cell wall assembly regulator SMI1